jgi:hypothetical protein
MVDFDDRGIVLRRALVRTAPKSQAPPSDTRAPPHILDPPDARSPWRKRRGRAGRVAAADLPRSPPELESRGYCGWAASWGDASSVGARSSSLRHSAPLQVRSSASRVASAATSAGSAVSTTLASW